jgi:hypothetical protein
MLKINITNLVMFIITMVKTYTTKQTMAQLTIVIEHY